MLTPNAAYTLRTGTKTQLTSDVTLSVRTLFDYAADQFTVYVNAYYSGTQVDGVILTYTVSELTSNTSSGANDIAKAHNLIEQAVKDTLEGYPENGAVTFTIS